MRYYCKYIILTIILIYSFKILHSQNNDWNSNNFPDSRFLGVFKVDNAYFGAISNGSTSFYDSNTIHQLTIVELNFSNLDSGMIVEEKENIDFDDDYSTASIEYIEETEQWIIVQSLYISDFHQKYRVLLCDKEFKIITEQSKIIDGAPILFNIRTVGKKTYIVGSILGPPDDIIFYFVYRHELSPYLPEIETRQTVPDPTIWITSIDIDENTNYINMFYINGIVVIDTNFNIIKKLKYNDIHTSDHGTLVASDSNYYSHGATRQTNQNVIRSLVLQKYDSSFNIIKADTFGRLGQDNYPFIGKSLDYSNSKILIGGMFDGPLNPSDINKTIKKFYLAKYDDKLNKIWCKEYGGDRAYMLYGLKLLENGDCLAYGYITDSITGIWNGYLLHVNANGELITRNEFIYSDSQEFIINYTNNNEIEIVNKSIIKGKILIYDMSGRIIMNKLLSGYNQLFDSSNLPNGIYGYAVISNNSVIKSGKLIIAFNN